MEIINNKTPLQIKLEQINKPPPRSAWGQWYVVEIKCDENARFLRVGCCFSFVTESFKGAKPSKEINN